MYRMLTFHEENLSQRQTWLQSHAAMPRDNYITGAGCLKTLKRPTAATFLPHVVSQVDRPGAHSRDL